MSNMNPPQKLNYPNSMNLNLVKETATPSMKGHFLDFTSQNTTYKARDTIRIPIANTANTWLHGNDSFLSCRVKISGTSTGGVLSLDSTVYSMFKSCRIIQGGNVLVEQQECGRLWNALFDLQVNGADRSSKEITMGMQVNGGITNYSVMGTNIVSEKYLYFCFALPVSILGTLSEKSFPLGAITSPLMLEIEVEDCNKFITTRENTNGPLGQYGSSTAISDLSVEVDNIVYHAKVSNVGEYNELLLGALGSSVTIPGVEYRHDKREIDAGKNSITPTFSYPLKSMKAFLFFFTNSKTSNGEKYSSHDGTTQQSNNQLNSAITQRTGGGNLKNFSLRIDGQSFPSTAIDCSAGDNLALNTHPNIINGSIPFQHLLRAFNLNSSTNAGGILSSNLYSSTISTHAGDEVTKRALFAIDLDRGSNDSDKYFMGVDVQNATTALYLTWNAGIVEPQTLFTYAMHDVGFIIQDGVCIASK
jgi:hypothetical protein